MKTFQSCTRVFVSQDGRVSSPPFPSSPLISPLSLLVSGPIPVGAIFFKLTYPPPPPVSKCLCNKRSSADSLFCKGNNNAFWYWSKIHALSQKNYFQGGRVNESVEIQVHTIDYSPIPFPVPPPPPTTPLFLPHRTMLECWEMIKPFSLLYLYLSARMDWLVLSIFSSSLKSFGKFATFLSVLIQDRRGSSGGTFGKIKTQDLPLTPSPLNF